MKPFLSLLLLFASVVSAPAITIDTVPIGHVGNPNDPATGNLYGGVSYAYNIGKYEVTVGQYTAFLNAVAATDTYGLYHRFMAEDLESAGITQNCSPNCIYSVIGSPNHPVTFVQWADTLRFANWLHNGQPVGAQDATTTEDGAYTLNGATTNPALLSVVRNAGARWFLPNENEWYKAAYNQPATAGGDSDGYWEYPMKTNSIPYSDQPPGATPDNSRVANFFQHDALANGYDDGYAVTGSISNSILQNYLTDVGAYSSSPSYYGTFDQGGNVYEWNETPVGSGRGLRGGSWGGFVSNLAASNRQFTTNLDGGGDYVGFRVATLAIPEPTSVILLLAGLFGFTCTARRR